MHAFGIVIEWAHSSEYVLVDPNALGKLSEISTTTEWWPAAQRFVRYNTSSQIRRLKGGAVELKLTYRRSENPDIAEDASCWGESTVQVQPNAESGEAEWRDFDYPENNGVARWSVSGGGLLKKASRQHYSKLQRQQDRFRLALLEWDKRCTLTGESTPEALEAAHIIPSRERGAEVVENGILLRADLHRLYDSGRFTLDLEGRVVDIQGVSEEYRRLLSGKRLPKETLERVQGALRHRREVRT